MKGFQTKAKIILDFQEFLPLGYCSEVRFASFLCGGFINATVVNSPERKLAKHTSVYWSERPHLV